MRDSIFLNNFNLLTLLTVLLFNDRENLNLVQNSEF
jgi:hypothetical protein